MTRTTHTLLALVLCAAAAIPGAAVAATKTRTLVQLKGPAGCLVDSSRESTCAPAQALLGPGPFLGSHALAVSPDGKHLYVASSESDAIAVFERDARTGKLTQPAGTDGCIAEAGAGGCATGLGLDGPNSVALSADGSSVYATSVNSDAVAVFTRNPSTGALSQAADGTGCISNAPVAGCTPGRALDGADVVGVSPDGRNVYVGAFFGSAVAVFSRDASTGALTQPPDETGCITNAPTADCTTGLALGAPEGLAVSADGASVYVAAALSSAVAVFDRDAVTGALTQPGDGTGCIVERPLDGCATGRQLAGANALAVSPDDKNVYVTSLFSNSVTSFARDSDGLLSQLPGTKACVKDARSVGCSLGHGLSAPEGIAVGPGGKRVYAAAFETGAVDTFRRRASGSLSQKPLGTGCIARRRRSGCERGRALRGASSVAVSPGGNQVYATAVDSDAIGVFKWARREKAPGKGCSCGAS